MTKEDVKTLLSIKGEVRGKLSHHAEAIVSFSGEKGLKEVEGLLEKLGYPMERENLQRVRYYKIGEMILYLMAIKEALNWDEKKFKKMGRTVGKKLVIIKYLSPLFRLNNKFFFERLPQFSNRFFKGLKMTPLEADLSGKQGKFEISGLIMDENKPIIKEVKKIAISYFSGLFESWAQAILGVEKVNCEIISKGEGKYIFKITW